MARGSSPFQRNGTNHFSPRRFDDSPSRQLQYELERTFAQIQIQETERQKLYVFNRKQIQDDLDARESAQAVAHQSELDQAIAKHEAVRHQAVLVLEAHIKAEEEKQRRKEEEARLRREDEQRRKAEEQRKAKEEREHKAREEQHRQETARRIEEEKARAEEQQRQQRESTVRREQEEQAKAKQQADAEAEAQATRQREEEEKVAAAEAAAEAAKVAKQSSPNSADPEIRHQHYLDIHKKLKQFRKDFLVEIKKQPELKRVAGEMRRTLKQVVGQLSTDDKAINKTASTKVKTTLEQALKDVKSPPVPLNDYLPPHLNLLDKNTTTIPSLLIYLVSIFSKAIINAFVFECAMNVNAAEPIGTLAAQAFSMPSLQFKRNVPSSNSGLHYEAFGGNVPTPPIKPESVSLITILLAKYHATAPQLFGISGNEETSAGKLRSGWRKDTAVEGAQRSFVLEQQQNDRLVGLGAGWAAIALRNFSKASLINPVPPSCFWESLAHIVDTEPQNVQQSQLILLKSILENSLDRFVLFFGATGIAALRHALIEFPAKLPPAVRERSTAKFLGSMADTWKKDLKFQLD